MAYNPNNPNGQTTMANSAPVVIASDQTSVPVKSTAKFTLGSTSALTITSLNALASSATAGWQSDRISNLVTLASDYEINVNITLTAATGSDKAVYVYVCPFYTTDGGTTWSGSSQGTATFPTGSQGATTIASPNNLRLLGVLNYTTTTSSVRDTFLLSNCFGNRMPDGFSIIIINFSGSPTSPSGNIVQYTAINDNLT